MKYEIKEIEISRIKADKNQPRKTFDDESLQHLAESILSNGLLNPIEVDENFVITDGERRWRAHKLAKLKTITVRVVSNKDQTEKLRRQLIFTLQDEEIPTDERYKAIVELWKFSQPKNKNEFCKDLGIPNSVLTQALDFGEFAEEEPELAKQVSARVIADTKGLPKEERLELIKEFKNIPKEEKKTELMRELVREKKEKLEAEKQIKLLNEQASQKEIKIITDRERALRMRDEIMETQKHFDRLMMDIRWAHKKKFYFQKPKQRDDFIQFLETSSNRARKWADELDQLRQSIEIEIIKE